MEQKNSFNMNTVLLTTTITLSFMMRNTSPIGWVPLLAIKVLFEGALLPFLIAGIFVAVPVMAFTIYVDTLFYKGTIDLFDPVLTSYNFMKVNLLHNLSAYFGTDPWWQYIFVFALAIFRIMWPAMVLSLFNHLRTKQNKKEWPYLTFYNVFYLIVFSVIPHKEMRFLLPILPFAFIMIGELLAQIIKKDSGLSTVASLSIKIFIAVELIVMAIYVAFH